MCKKICLILILPIILCSCGDKSAVPPVLCFSAVAVVQQNGANYTCTVMHTAYSITTITIKAPQSLNGLTYKWQGGNYSIEYNGLVCNTDNLYIPQKSFANLIAEVLDNAEKAEDIKATTTENNIAQFCGKTDNCQYIIFSDEKEGTIQSINIDNGDYMVSFNDVKELK